MEFFAQLAIDADQERIQQELTIDNLPRFCASIDKVLASTGDSGEIYCLWGQFRVNREPIRGGVRFTLPGCPNALAWTVTTDLAPEPAQLVLHCTINRMEHEPDFIESIRMFVDDWKNGLARELNKKMETAA